MTIKIKLSEIRKHYAGLIDMQQKTFPSRLGYAIMKNIKVLSGEYELLEEKRMEICQKFAMKDSDGEPITKKEGNIEKYVFSTVEDEKANEEEFKELLDMEVEIDIHTVKYEIIDQCHERERYSIPTVLDLETIDFMIED